MSKETTENRKAYVKPEIRRVELKPEESLVAGCKVVGGSAAGPNLCELSVCFNAGS
jgi:hypothetical protein